MQRIVLIAGALVILASAFPAQAHRAIEQISLWLDTITPMVSPGQQTILLIVAILLATAGLSRGQ